MEKQTSQTSFTTKAMQTGFTDRSLLCLYKDNCPKPLPFQYRAQQGQTKKETEGTLGKKYP